MTYKTDCMYSQAHPYVPGRVLARTGPWIYATLPAVLLIAGCRTGGPVDENQPMFTMEEMVSANQKAAANAWSAGRRAAEADFAAERANVKARIDEAVAKGRVEGDAIAVKRIEAEQAAAKIAAAETAAAGAVTARRLFSQTPLLGGRKLRSDKGRALEAGQIVDMVGTQLESIDYKLVISVPTRQTKAVRNYDQQKILLVMSTEFNEAFIERIEKMSLMDGLNLLNKLYGFSAWIAHTAKVVYLGFPASPPVPLPATKIDLYFNEKEFMERVK